MRKLLVFIALACFLVPVEQNGAQDETPGWPIEQRCVEPARAPEGWTYPGVILVKGWAGLHGVSAAWSTPHVLAFIDKKGWLPGSLSPDGDWYAVPQMDWWSRDLYTPTYQITVTQIGVYSTIDSVGSLLLPWDLYGIETQSDAFPVIRWKDNDHFIYLGAPQGPDGLVLVDPAQNEITQWEETGFEVLEENFFPSPDWNRGVLINETRSLLTVYDTTKGDVISRLDFHDSPSRVYKATWSTWSDSFLVLTATYDKASSSPYVEQLVLYDADGNPIEVVAHFAFSHAEDFIYDVIWSPDGRYIALQVIHYGDDRLPIRTLYLADTEQRRILDTCLSIWLGAWSPTGPLLAVTAPGDKVRVFDVENWQLYTVAYHDGTVIGWRE